MSLIIQIVLYSGRSREDGDASPPANPDRTKFYSSQTPNSRSLFSFSSTTLKLTYCIEQFKNNGQIQGNASATANPSIECVIYHSNIL